MIESLVTSEPLDPSSLCQRAQSPEVGAIVPFIGTVRISSGMKEREGKVVRLEYEAYVPMAEQEMKKIGEEAAEKFGAVHVLTHHRVGVLEPGEAAVCIVVATPHRSEGFDGCRYVIEELKKRVPIWKKEVFADGAEWVDPRP